jgi:two-component system, OmpR family, sensor kinase
MKNIIIESNIEQDIYILINPKQLQRVVDNNISNAIKYSYEENKIEVHFYIKDGVCSLSFKGYGVGIEKVNKIFTRYYREDVSKGGFGIGLNIVKSIIDSYEIQLNIESKINQGSTFKYDFPPEMVEIRG